MATNLNPEDALIGQARALGRHASEREAVNAALEEYISSSTAPSGLSPATCDADVSRIAACSTLRALPTAATST